MFRSRSSMPSTGRAETTGQRSLKRPPAVSLAVPSVTPHPRRPLLTAVGCVTQAHDTAGKQHAIYYRARGCKRCTSKAPA